MAEEDTRALSGIPEVKGGSRERNNFGALEGPRRHLDVKPSLHGTRTV
ncbi:hypothetical protein FOCG_02785 [Fusarium oxysporum f. sp. radicis-lycopersici 26381]|uniref:Uncharacterized protein n=1 Tax=Fusarium oxysporum Fo47 TaxID=660027 RepID=W9KL56_FUSOX|nr:hypothetical protein FOZG_07060 [Fusarium oxysporum Fo47]EXA00919.1 hypothetical protein FOWG_00985 [Fusarium oxysporum f. sp. lycopersici MN25]EXL59602.1 hypothetical protein FOCG_02785 [Fusarium oxysporum f. sp. radicis-lycopersici 26381]